MAVFCASVGAFLHVLMLNQGLGTIFDVELVEAGVLLVRGMVRDLVYQGRAEARKDIEGG